MKIFITITALFLFNCAFAQDTIKQKPSCNCGFRSINQVGLLEGEAKSAFSIHTINGLSYNSWSAGIGVGIDYYHTRSIPLFIDIRKNLLRAKNSPFVYGDAGISFTWADSEQSQRHFGNDGSDFSNGIYYDMGLGYRVGLKNAQGILLSAGYTRKTLKESVTSTVPCLIPPCPEYTQSYNYSLHRLAIRLGWQF
ncbi:MAG: hypothetical protein H7Y27_16685 [Gemmatimonadaceae bacterium]|nr:hypothetical protein [Chitinophagaceae bacterium]